MSVYRLACPHCRERLRIRTSEGIHPFLRVAYLQCTYEPCSWGGRAQFEMTHELSPSGMPDPTVRLPRASRGSLEGNNPPIRQDTHARARVHLGELETTA